MNNGQTVRILAQDSIDLHDARDAAAVVARGV